MGETGQQHPGVQAAGLPGLDEQTSEVNHKAVWPNAEEAEG